MENTETDKLQIVIGALREDLSKIEDADIAYMVDLLLDEYTNCIALTLRSFLTDKEGDLRKQVRELQVELVNLMRKRKEGKK